MVCYTGQSGQDPGPPAGDIVLNEYSSANRGQENAVRRDLVILDVPWLINGVWVNGKLGMGVKATHWFETEMS